MFLIINYDIRITAFLIVELPYFTIFHQCAKILKSEVNRFSFIIQKFSHIKVKSLKFHQQHRLLTWGLPFVRHAKLYKGSSQSYLILESQFYLILGPLESLQEGGRQINGYHILETGNGHK